MSRITEAQFRQRVALLVGAWLKHEPRTFDLCPYESVAGVSTDGVSFFAGYRHCVATRAPNQEGRERPLLLINQRQYRGDGIKAAPEGRTHAGVRTSQDPDAGHMAGVARDSV